MMARERGKTKQKKKTEMLKKMKKDKLSTHQSLQTPKRIH